MTKELKVSKAREDRPVPPKKPGAPAKYPAFAALSPGQSVTFEGEQRELYRVRNAAYEHAKRHGWDIRTRTADGELTVWRAS